MNLNLNPSPHKIKIEELKREALLKVKQNIDEVVARNKIAALKREKLNNNIKNEGQISLNFNHNWDHFDTLTQNQKAVLEAIQNVKDRCSLKIT
jgi:hypothetical protein